MKNHVEKGKLYQEYNIDELNSNLNLKSSVTKAGGAGWLSGKESACNAGVAEDAGSVPTSGRSLGGGHGNPFQYSCLENPCGQRSLLRYSPYGRKESDTTEMS